MKDKRIYVKISINILLAIAIILTTIFVVPQLLGFFLPFVIGWMIAMIANPLVKLLEMRLRIVRKHGSAIIIILVLAIVIGVLYFLISMLVRECIALASDLPGLYQNIEGSFQDAMKELEGVRNMMPERVQDYIDNIFLHLNEYTTKFLQNMDAPTLNDAGVFAKNLAESLFMIIITVLSSYFFIAERENLIHSVKKTTPQSIQEYYRMIMDNFKKAVGGYLKAQFKIMIIIFVILLVGFGIMGVGYGILIALGIAFLDFLPVFGTGAVIWPWALFEMITGDYFRAIGLVVLYLVCQVVKQLLQPKMVGDSIGMSPLMTLVLMFIGYRIKGILGLLLGIPIGMIILNFYRAGVFDNLIRGFKILIHDINEYRKF